MSCYQPRVCNVPGCENPTMFNGFDYRGLPTYKPRCSKHHQEHFAAKKGMTRSEWNRKILENVAAKQGMSVAEYLKASHPYHKYRKNHCENALGIHAGWLPVPCSIVEFEEKFLHIDHLDGDHDNNDPENLMTLCPTCHAVKTWIFDCVSHDNNAPITQEMNYELGLET